MSDFTIKVFRHPGDPVLASEVKVIGNQLKALANELPALIASGATIHRTSEMRKYEVGNSENWTTAATTAVETLFDALSFQLWDGNSVDRDVGHDDPEKSVHDHVKLVFVFEEDGQMVVPVPTAKNIDRGEKHAPLRLPAEYDFLVSEGTAAEIGRRLADAIGSATGGELASIEPIEVDAIVTEIMKIADQMRAEIEGDVPFFKAQLGDYSVRQCCGG